MTLRRLRPAGFRNLADAWVDLGEGLTVFHGANGAGKTNFLEAIYFAISGRSCRTASDRDVVNFDEKIARVEVELSAESDRRLLASVARSGERRHTIDGTPVGPETERPLASVFLPERLQLVKGPPAGRRTHLDGFIAALWPARADLRGRFGRALAQRNALVARIRAGVASATSLSSWEEELARTAEPLIASRAEALDTLAAPLARAGEALGFEEVLGCRYRPRCEPDTEVMAAEMRSLRQEELGRAYTGFGPQLDEVLIEVGGRSLRRFGSQGQQRLALLALLLAEAEVLADAGRPAPVMLLDDVMSELDPQRRELLVQWLERSGQAFVTATEPGHVPAQGATLIAVRNGRATRLAEAA